MKKLYHYIHCPFCVRVRMALGFLDIEYESVVLPYHDEETPIQLTGVKMLPIYDDGDDSPINESLDIIRKIDAEKKLYSGVAREDIDKVEELCSVLGSPIHSLCMPYWVYSKEFSDESRGYFLKKKEAKRGPFNKLAQNKSKFLNQLYPLLRDLKKDLTPYFQSSDLTIKDIVLASHLWGLYVLPEFQFEPQLHDYLQRVKNKCKFDYHYDFWIDSK